FSVAAEFGIFLFLGFALLPVGLGVEGERVEGGVRMGRGWREKGWRVERERVGVERERVGVESRGGKGKKGLDYGQPAKDCQHNSR
ncbi:MAG: hypothetical protein ACFB0G_02495, partial [Leptolyngbyaceae cyanobacterium]